MRYWKIICSILVISLLGHGCSNPVYVQKDDATDFTDYKTYKWVTTRASQDDESQRATAYADISIHNAVNKELGKEGWQEVNLSPDVFLMYDILVENSSTEQRDAVYTRPYSRMFYNPYRRHWVTFYYPSRFVGYDLYETPVKEATITVTMMDARTDKKVWQGWTTVEMNDSRLSADAIARNVKNIFNKFDVAMR